MAAPLILRIIGDASSYVKTAETTIATNTKIAQSFSKIGTTANLSAEAQVAAAVKAIRAQEQHLAALRAVQARSVAGSREQIAATVAVGDAQERLNRITGLSTSTLNRSGLAAESAGRRFRGFARSLLSVTAGFLGFQAVSSLIRGAIKGADDLSSAQKSLALAVQNTGGNLARLQPRYAATAEGARKYGEDVATATTELARATLLTGGAVKAQRAYGEALVISKALGKDFNAVLTATAKGQDGLTSSLTKYGVILTKGATGQEQFSAIMGRFAGLAKANTSNIDVYNASLRNSEIIIGGALLPVLNKYLGQLGEWLTKMNKSGKLQKDVNEIVHAAVGAFRFLGHIIGVVDRVTGSLTNSLKLLLGLKVASVIGGWTSTLGMLTGAERAGGLLGASAAAGGLVSKLSRLRALAAKAFVVTVLLDLVPRHKNPDDPTGIGSIPIIGGLWSQGFRAGEALGHVLNPQREAAGSIQAWLDAQGPAGPMGPNLGPSTHPRVGRGGAASGGVSRWASYQLNIAEQIAQAQAALTRTTKDDVANAKAIIARIKRVIDAGHLHGAALVQALQLEASAIGTLQAAEAEAAQARASAAQKRTEAAQRAKERIQAQIQDSIDPLRLEVALSRAEALGKPLTRILKKMREAAQKALESGKLSLEQQKEAWDQIASINERLKSSLEATSRATLGKFKQANIDKIAKDLGLSGEQAKALKSQLSQLGPGQTRPSHGTGAYGYQVGAGGTVHHHHHHVSIDGKQVETRVRHHRGKRRRRNSSQRRGPNAGWDD